MTNPLLTLVWGSQAYPPGIGAVFPPFALRTRADPSLLRWADVPVTTHSELFVTPEGCSHGSPTVKYRGVFLNDEQPALTNWALEKFTNGTGAPLTGSPFNHTFYSKLWVVLADRVSHSIR